MRSAKTNAFQAAVLISGVMYIIIGAAFIFSPLTIFQFFAENVSENWIDLVRDHELVAPMYFTVRAFGVLLLTSGFLMIMPLFDPLKYRGIAYLNGVLFPFISAVILLKNGLFIGVKRDDSIHGNYMHLPIVIFGIILSVVFLIVLLTLLLTRKDAKEGRE
ncbi:MAG: hypothetical protein CVV49_05765 [Spirochaetae bacterium HGW-Spirochaetae-5]|nr:MAG: hypothetical protein CVV49_05765 [Spirochaetae bacterium HGW-Spirochaetae-5]